MRTTTDEFEREIQMAKFLITLTFNLDHPEDVGEVIRSLDPTHAPWFSGEARICIDPIATQIEEWLDDEEE